MKGLFLFNPARNSTYILGTLIVLFFAAYPLMGSTYPDMKKDNTSEYLLSSPGEMILNESVLGLESWMMKPFENSVADAELEVESWMMKPFKNSATNPELLIEEETYSNSEDRLLEENPLLENWMTDPF